MVQFTYASNGQRYRWLVTGTLVRQERAEVIDDVLNGGASAFIHCGSLRQTPETALFEASGVTPSPPPPPRMKGVHFACVP